MSATLTIKMTKGSREFPIEVDLTATISELKEMIAIEADIPKENIRLVCAGKIWQDVSPVSAYSPADGAIVHCLNNAPKNPAPTAAEQTLSPVNPMQAMMGAGASTALAQPADSSDPFAAMMQQSQQMMAQNPEMMQQLMDSPMVQQMMSNPETMRAMMSMNPRMQQLMEQRPEIARMLEDPEVIQQSMNMMRNPSLMREMQRNQDLSIGRLDAMPGGHNALVRAHEDLIDPMMSAISGGGGDAAATMAEYGAQNEGGPNTAPLSNPWGAPAASPTPAPAAATTPAAAPAFPMMGAPGSANPMGAAGAPGANPMANMMQQMMANPAMMQQSMQMAQAMGMGGGMGGYGQPAAPGQTAVPGQTAPAGDATNPAAAPVAPVNPFAAMMGGMPPAGGAAPNAMAGGAAPNPMAAMMQQMMQNPAMMQSAMQMSQGMNQQGGMGAMGGMGGGMPGGFPGFQAPAAAPVMDDATARVTFATQLASLSAMGFTNESACLRALQQHHGRVDAAIDALLAEGASTSE